MFINCDNDSDENDNPVADEDPFTGTIGDYYQGGSVFYLDGNGGGLIAANYPIDTKIAKWGCMDEMEMLTGAIGTAIGTGAQNTLDILAFCSEEGIAAKLCADYEVTVGGVTYDDWFLPSLDELEELYNNKDALTSSIPTIDLSGSHWSSSQTDYNDPAAPVGMVWYVNLNRNGYVNKAFSDSEMLVRAIRAF